MRDIPCMKISQCVIGRSLKWIQLKVKHCMQWTGLNFRNHIMWNRHNMTLHQIMFMDCLKMWVDCSWLLTTDISNGGGNMQIDCKVRKCSDVIWFIARYKADIRCSALISFRHLDIVDCRYHLISFRHLDIADCRYHLTSFRHLDIVDCRYHGRRLQQGGRGSLVEGHWCWEHRKHKRLVQGRGGFFGTFWNI